MFKKVLKIFGIVFGSFTVFFGVILGAMFLMGKFDKPHIEPNKLYFDLNYDESSKSYYMDVTYYCKGLTVKGEKASNIYSFTLRANPEDVTELNCNMVVESGKELIEFCDKDGNKIPNEQMSNVRINYPVYFKISDKFDNSTADYALTNGKVKIYFNTENSLCNGFLTINIDRQVSSVSLYDYTNENNNIHTNGKFAYEKTDYVVVSLSSKPDSWAGYFVEDGGDLVPVNAEAEFNSDLIYYKEEISDTLKINVSANVPYPIVPIYAPENSNQPFNSVEGKNCEIYVKNGAVYENIETTTNPYFYLDTDGVYKMKSSEPGEHIIYLVSYPTYAIQNEAKEYFENEINSDNIIFNNPYSISRKIVITVTNFGVKKVKFMNKDSGIFINLDLFKENYFVLSNDSLGQEYTNLQVEMFNNEGAKETSRLNQVKFYGGEDFEEGGLIFTGNSGAKIILTNTGVASCSGFNTNLDGTKNYIVSYNAGGKIEVKIIVSETEWAALIFNPISSVSSEFKLAYEGFVKTGELIADTEVFTCNKEIILAKRQYSAGVYNYSIGSIKVGSYFVFAKGNNEYNSLFDIKSSGYGANKQFSVLPKKEELDLKLYLFVVNEGGDIVWTGDGSSSNYASVSIKSSNTALETGAAGDLKIKYSTIAGGGIEVTTSLVDVSKLVTATAGSYTIPILFAKANSKVNVCSNVVINVSGVDYYLVGEFDKVTYAFNNVVKPKVYKDQSTGEYVVAGIGTQDLYIALIKYSYGITNANELLKSYLSDANIETWFDSDDTNDIILTNIGPFGVENNRKELKLHQLIATAIDIDIKFAESFSGESSDYSKLLFNGTLNEQEITEDKVTIKEETKENELLIKINADSPFSQSKLFEFFTKGDADNNLLSINEYFKLNIKLYNASNRIVQQGSVYSYNDDGKLVYKTSNSVLDNYISITSAKFDTVNNTLLFEFDICQDPEDIYTDDTGHYFVLEFECSNKKVSSKIGVQSTAVIEYLLNGKNSSNKITINANYCVKSGTLYIDTDFEIGGEPGYSLDITARTWDNETGKDIEIDAEELDFNVASTNTQVLTVYKCKSIDSKYFLDLYPEQTGNAQIIITNIEKPSVVSTFNVEIKTQHTWNNDDKTATINTNEYDINNNFKFNGEVDGKDGDIFNKLNKIGEDFYLLTEKPDDFDDCFFNYYKYDKDNGRYENLTGDDNWGAAEYYVKQKYWSKQVNFTLSVPAGYFVDDGEYYDYNKMQTTLAKILSENKKLVTTKPTGWDSWTSSDFRSKYYYDADGNKINSPTTWEDGKIYSNLVATLLRDQNEEKFKLIREENFTLDTFEFTLKANCFGLEKSVIYTYDSPVKITKNTSKTVIEYYDGTQFKLAATKSDSNYDNVSYQLVDEIGKGFTLQYKKADGTYLDISATGASGNVLTINAEVAKEITDYAQLNEDGTYDLRIFYNETKNLDFKLKILQNVIVESKNNAENVTTFSWHGTKTQDLSDEFNYYEYDTSATIVDYEKATLNSLSLAETTPYTLKSGREWDDIITLSDKTLLGLNWVHWTGEKTYEVELTANLNNGENVGVVYYVKVKSNFSINNIKDLPELTGYEEIDFDINEYFNIYNGKTLLTIEGFEITGDYIDYDYANKKLSYTKPISNTNNVMVSIVFTIEVDGEGREIKSVDSYEIIVNPYILTPVENSYIVGNGKTDTKFTNLFNINWDNIAQIDVSWKEDQGIVSSNSARLTKDLTELQLGAIGGSTESRYVQLNIKLFYSFETASQIDWGNVDIYKKEGNVYNLVTEKPTDWDSETYYKIGSEYEYTQSILVKGEYYAQPVYMFNDLIETFNSGAITNYNSGEAENISSNQYDLVVSTDKLDLKSKFEVYNSLTKESSSDNSVLTNVELYAYSGFSTDDCKKITITNTVVDFANIEGTGYLIFRLYNEYASCLYMVKVIQVYVSTNENYESVRNIGNTTNIRKTIVLDDYKIVGESKTVKDIISESDIATDSGVGATLISNAGLKYYIISDIGGSVAFTRINKGDNITDVYLSEIVNPETVTIAVVSAYSANIVHLINYQVTLLPNIEVTYIGHDNIKVCKPNKLNNYDIDIKYSYDDGADNKIDLSTLFTVSGDYIFKSESAIMTYNGDDSANIEGVDGKNIVSLSSKFLTLVRNIAEDINFTLKLTYGKLDSEDFDITLNVTYKAYENTNSIRSVTLGFNGSSFNYEFKTSEFIKEYTGQINYYIDNVRKESGIAFDNIELKEFVDNFANKLIELKIELLDIYTASGELVNYVFSINLEPSIFVTSDGAETLEVTNDQSQLKLIINHISDDSDYMMGHTGETFLIEFLQGELIKYNIYDEYYNECKNLLEKPDSRSFGVSGVMIDKIIEIQFIPLATEFKGFIGFKICDKDENPIYNEVFIELTIIKTYDVDDVKYPISDGTKESFAVGDNIDFETLISGGRYDFVALDKGETWDKDTYYYWNPTSKQYLKLTEQKLFDDYRSYLYRTVASADYSASKTYYKTNKGFAETTYTDSSAFEADKEYLIAKVDNSEPYDDTYAYTYYYSTNGTSFASLGKEDAIKNLFAKYSNNYYKKVNRDKTTEFYIEKYVEVVDKSAAEWKPESYYTYNVSTGEYSEIKTLGQFEATASTIYEKIVVTSSNGEEFVKIDKDKYVWGSETYYDSSYKIITAEDGYKAATEVYIKQKISRFNSTTINSASLWDILNKENLNKMQLEVQYNTADGYVEDVEKSYAYIENNTLYFLGAGDVRLKIYNNTGLEVYYYITIAESANYVDNIKFATTDASGVVGVGGVDKQYISVTLEELNAGYDLATLTYMPNSSAFFGVCAYGATNSVRLTSGSATGRFVHSSIGLTIDYEVVSSALGKILKISSETKSLSTDKVYFDLYFVTENGIIKTIRLYISNAKYEVGKNIDNVEYEELYANRDGVELTGNNTNGKPRLKYTNKEDVEVTLGDDDYALEYLKSYNSTDRVWYNATDSSLIRVDSATYKFDIAGVSKDTFVTMYFGLKHDGVIIKIVEYKIKIVNDILISGNNVGTGSGNGWTLNDNNLTADIYLANYKLETDAAYKGYRVVDLINKQGDGYFRNEYLTYKNLRTNEMLLNGEATDDSTIYSLLSFRIINDNFIVRDDDSGIITEQCVIDEYGKLFVPQDKNGTVQVEVRAKYSTSYVIILTLNIKASITVAQKVPTSSYLASGFKSGDEVELISSDKANENAMWRLYQQKTNNSYKLENYNYPLGLSVTYWYNVKTDEPDVLPTDFTDPDMWTLVKNGADDCHTLGSGNKLQATLPSVPVSGTQAYFVSYKIEFYINSNPGAGLAGTRYIYYANYQVRQEPSLEIATDYEDKALVVGTSDCFSENKLYLYKEGETTGYLFTADSAHKEDAETILKNNKVLLDIKDNGNGTHNQVLYNIQVDTNGYYITLDKDSEGNLISDLFYNSMTFNFVFVDKTNDSTISYEIQDWTMKSNNSIALDINKKLNLLFTTTELGEELAKQNFNWVGDSTEPIVTDFIKAAVALDYELNYNGSPKIVKRNSDDNIYEIYSATLTKSSGGFYKLQTTVYYVNTENDAFVTLANGYSSIAYTIYKDDIRNATENIEVDLSKYLGVYYVSGSGTLGTSGIGLESNGLTATLGANKLSFAIATLKEKLNSGELKSSYTYTIEASGGEDPRIITVVINIV